MMKINMRIFKTNKKDFWHKEVNNNNHKIIIYFNKILCNNYTNKCKVKIKDKPDNNLISIYYNKCFKDNKKKKLLL